jgi:hypothetical protein
MVTTSRAVEQSIRRDRGKASLWTMGGQHRWPEREKCDFPDDF